VNPALAASAKRPSSKCSASPAPNGPATASGSVPEGRLRGQELETDEVARERPQGEKRLESGDAAAGDHDAEAVAAPRMTRARHVGVVRPRKPRYISVFPVHQRFPGY
jgi:hypothetical protein